SPSPGTGCQLPWLLVCDEPDETDDDDVAAYDSLDGSVVAVVALLTTSADDVPDDEVAPDVDAGWVVVAEPPAWPAAIAAPRATKAAVLRAAVTRRARWAGRRRSVMGRASTPSLRIGCGSAVGTRRTGSYASTGAATGRRSVKLAPP